MSPQECGALSLSLRALLVGPLGLWLGDPIMTLEEVAQELSHVRRTPGMLSTNIIL